MSDNTPLYRPSQSGANNTRPIEAINLGEFGRFPSPTPPWPTPAPRRGRRALIAASVAGVGVLAAGGFTAFALLSGGGTQPDEVLPASAIAYVRIDFDPAAGQKVAALDLVDKLPEDVRDDDLRKAAWNLLAAEDSALGDIDFDTDIAPWAGDRLGLALLPAADVADQPVVVLAVQVKDEQKARDGIQLLAGDAAAGVAFENGYALIAQTQEQADAAAAAPEHLSDDVEYRAALDRVGDPGVATVWVDLAAAEQSAQAAAAANGVDPAPMGEFGEDLALAVRFADGRIELEGEVTGVDSSVAFASSNAGYRVADLPASTAAAVQIDGLGPAFVEMWPQVEALIPVHKLGDSLGLTLPDDVAAVLGDRIVVALDGRSPTDGVGGLMAGAVSVTDKAEHARGVVERILSAELPDWPVSVDVDDDRLYVALDPGYAAELRGDGALGEEPTFADVVADPDAGFVFYANVDQLADMFSFGEEPAPATSIEDAITAIGASASRDGDTARFSVRVSLD